MARPPKRRRVEFIPGITCFKPAGIPLSSLETVVLTVDELEAIRLKDIQDLEQEDCAESMGVSRATFFRILSSARKKIATALIEGKAISIKGGNFKFYGNLRCKKCGSVWSENYVADEDGILKCPKCNSQELSLASNSPGRCRRRRRGNGI